VTDGPCTRMNAVSPERVLVDERSKKMATAALARFADEETDIACILCSASPIVADLCGC